MNISQDVLLVLLLSIFTSANNVDLNTNSNFLLLLLLVLTMEGNTCPQRPTCNGFNRDFF